LLLGQVERVHWYSLYDLPLAWPATTRHREAEGSSHYRHFYMGLLREDGTPKAAAKEFGEFAHEMGLCQWFHFEDHRLEAAVQKLRTGLSWSDSLWPGAEAFYDRQMPNELGVRADYTSPPREPEAFADFCAAMVKRYC